MSSPLVVRGLYRALLRSARRVEHAQRLGGGGAEPFAAAEFQALASQYSSDERLTGRLLGLAPPEGVTAAPIQQHVQRVFRQQSDDNKVGEAAGFDEVQRCLKALSALSELATSVELVSHMQSLARSGDAGPANKLVDTMLCMDEEAGNLGAELQLLADDAARHLAESAPAEGQLCPFALVAAVNYSLYDRSGFTASANSTEMGSLGDTLASRCGDPLALTAVWVAVAGKVLADAGAAERVELSMAQYPTRLMVRLDLGGAAATAERGGAMVDGSLWAGEQQGAGAHQPTPEGTMQRTPRMCVVRMRAQGDALLGEPLAGDALRASGAVTPGLCEPLFRVDSDRSSPPPWLRPIDLSEPSHRWWYADAARGGELLPEACVQACFTARGWLRGGRGWQRHATEWTDGETGTTVEFQPEEAASLRSQAEGAAGAPVLIRAVLDRAAKRAVRMTKGSMAEVTEVRRRWKAAAAEILTPSPTTGDRSTQPNGGAAAINLGTGTNQWSARMYPPTGVTGEAALPKYSAALPSRTFDVNR